MSTKIIIRLTHPKLYRHNKQRFSSEAFKNSTGGGISVIEIECAIHNSQTICDHISKFYPSRVSGDPPVFFKLECDEANLVQQTTETGDVCHYNLMNKSDKECSRDIKSKTLSDFCICAATGLRTLTLTDLTL